MLLFLKSNYRNIITPEISWIKNLYYLKLFNFSKCSYKIYEYLAVPIVAFIVKIIFLGYDLFFLILRFVSENVQLE